MIGVMGMVQLDMIRERILESTLNVHSAYDFPAGAAVVDLIDYPDCEMGVSRGC